MLPRRAIASNPDALAEAWEWTGADVVAHGLPMFHVHGLILGTLGPLRRGGTAHHLGRFSAEAAAAAFERDGATMLFAVPTMTRLGRTRLTTRRGTPPVTSQRSSGRGPTYCRCGWRCSQRAAPMPAISSAGIISA